jgi:hypothetical protein
MNKTERTMVELLKNGREEHGVVSVKAEFEAEGTRIDELLRLVEIARNADLSLTVKIGGCEAVRDLLDAKQIGVAYVVAPMVETRYALGKYLAAKNGVYDSDEQSDTDFLFNMETICGFENRNEIISAAAAQNGANGVVFGRVDFAGSLGETPSVVNNPEITSKVLEVAKLAKHAGLDFVLGGGISSEAIEVLKSVRKTHLSRFETRKIVFAGEAAESPELEKALLNAVHFEMLWLINKRNYYTRITQEDENRIVMLENRWRILGMASIH